MQIQRKFPGPQSLTLSKKKKGGGEGGQSLKSFWRELKQTKLTASNFGAAAKRCKEPDNLLKAIMHPKQFKSKSLMYGHMQEQNAVDDYVKCKHVEGITGLKVFEVENILSTRKPGLFTSKSLLSCSRSSTTRVVCVPKLKAVACVFLSFQTW